MNENWVNSKKEAFEAGESEQIRRRAKLPIYGAEKMAAFRMLLRARLGVRLSF